MKEARSVAGFSNSCQLSFATDQASAIAPDRRPVKQTTAASTSRDTDRAQVFGEVLLASEIAEASRDRATASDAALAAVAAALEAWAAA